MTSSVCADVDVGQGFKNLARRSILQASHTDSLVGSPASSSIPFIPPTPTHAYTTCRSLASDEPSSPPLPSAPANTPINTRDSGITSLRISEDDAGSSNTPDLLSLLRLHSFQQVQSPLTQPIVPPNSPETFAVAGDSMQVDDIQTNLSERPSTIRLAPSQEHWGSGIEFDDSNGVPKTSEKGYYEVRAVPGKGYGCFALKDLTRGTRILADDPLLIVPVADYFLEDIEAAFEKLSPKDQAYYFTLHSAHAQDPTKWPKHVHPTVPNRERCRIEEQHKARVGKEPSLISVFQTNCMELDNGAAVFPNAARFNHSCNPNACFTWNSAIHKETIHVIKDVKKGEHITLAYCDMTHDKATRAWELKHYGFECDCAACAGDDGDPDSFAGRSAARRYRLTELNEDFQYLRGPHLEQGVQTEGFVLKLLEYTKLLVEEGDYTARLASAYLDLALVCEQAQDLGFAKVCAQKALQIKIDCQGADFPEVKQFSAVVKRVEASSLLSEQ